MGATTDIVNDFFEDDLENIVEEGERLHYTLNSAHRTGLSLFILLLPSLYLLIP